MNDTLKKVLTNAAQRLIIFLVFYILAHAVFCIVVQDVGYLSFLYFWLALDILVGIAQDLTKRVANNASTYDEEELGRIYLVLVAIAAILANLAKSVL